MPSTVFSAAAFGIDDYPVYIEVDTDRTLPTFTVVGLPDSTVRESKERVLAAIKNAGYQWPRRRVTVNLAPADRRKEGSALDLPIALGILVASKQIKPVSLSEFALLGELSLNSSVRPVRGMLSMAASMLPARALRHDRTHAERPRGRYGGRASDLWSFHVARSRRQS